MSVSVSFPYGNGTFTVIAEGEQAEAALYQCMSVGDLIRFFETFSELPKSLRGLKPFQRALADEPGDIELAEIVRLQEEFVNEQLTTLGGISGVEALNLISFPLERRTSGEEE